MIFLINEQKKKTTKGGKGLCRVFLVHKTNAYNRPQVEDITKRISEIMKREKQFDWVNLTIHYWSGTGAMIIKEALKLYWGNDIVVQDISIF
jgi:hypothetical protein